MIRDFDIAFTTRFATASGLGAVFMPDLMFERKRIIDKLNNNATFSFMSIWREAFHVDSSRWIPSLTWNYEIGYYQSGSDDLKTTMFSMIPVKIPYQIILWETDNSTLMERKSQLIFNMMRNQTILVTDSVTQHLDMNCRLDFQEASWSLSYVTEKNDKVAYYRGQIDIEMDGWIYEHEMDQGVVEQVDMFYVSKAGTLIEEQWIPEEYISGYYSGMESGS